MKCIVAGCPNDSDQGKFVGELCSPCHKMLETGVVHPSTHSFIAGMEREIDHLKKELKAANVRHEIYAYIESEFKLMEKRFGVKYDQTKN